MYLKKEARKGHGKNSCLGSYYISLDLSHERLISQDIEDIMNVYMNIFLLLYADDTVLMAETPEDLQKQLNIFHDYCLARKLKVNIDKTKIVCFTNGRLPQNLQFTYSNSEIEIVKEFNYLGLLLAKT
jgi:hypothetical protein